MALTMFRTFLQINNSTETIEKLEEHSVKNVTYECYENFTIYYPLYNNAKFWIEGVLLILVGTLGLFGNLLTLAVLSQSKKSTFNQLLIALSICDRYILRGFISYVNSHFPFLSQSSHRFFHPGFHVDYGYERSP